ncbi:MAG: ImmA/IrrE family metallo-endopeptidase [Phycisphaerales bacterium]|jgi:hypothetical protein|nr:ImmA/IrrE family metallo-endopeptidase [Phycisphaerales bacterium]
MHPHVKAIMDETGETDPIRAVRAKAREVVLQFVEIFGGEPPFDLEAMASLRGLFVSREAPQHSPDSEIAPEGGRVVLRINRNRPLVRQRFSIGHEIGHTLFPDYQLAIRCRKSPDRDWADPNDQIETLCDVAASEILFPAPWFGGAVEGMAISGSGLVELANRFAASPEATIRRFVEIRTDPLAAVFCSWKLKPTEARRLAADRHQARMFGGDPAAPTLKLRVDYSILNEAFRSSCADHIPKDKSMPFEGSVRQAAQAQIACDATLSIDFGTTSGEFRTHAVPIFTPEERIGPDGAVSVAVVVQPTWFRRPCQEIIKPIASAQ